MDFRLPNLGEGIESATVTRVLVKPGDAVAAGQAVVDVETDKAAMPVEADADGTVEQVLVKAGDKIPVGAPLLKLASGESSKPSPPPPNPMNPLPKRPVRNPPHPLLRRSARSN